MLGHRSGLGQTIAGGIVTVGDGLLAAANVDTGDAIERIVDVGERRGGRGNTEDNSKQLASLY